MGAEPRYFDLSLEALRTIGDWAAHGAERALPLHATHANADSRPRPVDGAAAARGAGLAAASAYTHPLADG